MPHTEHKGLFLMEEGLRHIDQVELVQVVVGKVVELILVVGAVGIIDPISVLSNMFLTYQDNGWFRTPFVRGD